MAMRSSLRAVWAYPLVMNKSENYFAERNLGVKPQRRPFGRRWWGAVASLTYLRRDATALGLLLLSMLDITSSFH